VDLIPSFFGVASLAPLGPAFPVLGVVPRDWLGWRSAFAGALATFPFALGTVFVVSGATLVLVFGRGSMHDWRLERYSSCLRKWVKFDSELI
jgi:hypothetical protein